ncbi:hypothetical protein FRX31_003400 [Thalictrum thalictroides]|uniref:Uncharacterized protein n=1 Tax=Thalictrum thalictroides TaxID=46969 RepID=A0A7J6XDR7_THATH|nr:hypothetical protein FRX31_003400 [Thalictrum thalictroides]
MLARSNFRAQCPFYNSGDEGPFLLRYWYPTLQYNLLQTGIQPTSILILSRATIQQDSGFRCFCFLIDFFFGINNKVAIFQHKSGNEEISMASCCASSEI